MTTTTYTHTQKNTRFEIRNEIGFDVSHPQRPQLIKQLRNGSRNARFIWLKCKVAANEARVCACVHVWQMRSAIRVHTAHMGIIPCGPAFWLTDWLVVVS